MIDFETAFGELPLIAILRGIEPKNVSVIVEILVNAGFRLIEIPLNSPDALVSIKCAADEFGDVAIIGAGTVIHKNDVVEIHKSGGRLVVAPNVDPAVGQTALVNNSIWVPGVMTPTEAFLAMHAGAHALKIFPAEIMTAAGLKSLRAVLPSKAQLLPVGGISPETMPAYVHAGANGFGLGSALYRPGDSISEIKDRAGAFVQAAGSLFD